MPDGETPKCPPLADQASAAPSGGHFDAKTASPSVRPSVRLNPLKDKAADAADASDDYSTPLFGARKNKGMTALALKALAAANAAGVAVILDGDGLILDPTPPAALIAQIKAVKPDLLRILAGRVAARAIIHTAEPPPDCSPQRWVVARRGLKRFLDEGWGDQATLLGWTLEELYAVPPVWARVDLCGAALLIADRRVVAITEATITTVGVTGSHLKFYRAPRVRVADVVAEDVKADVVGRGCGRRRGRRRQSGCSRRDHAP